MKLKGENRYHPYKRKVIETLGSLAQQRYLLLITIKDIIRTTSNRSNDPMHTVQRNVDLV